LIVFLNWNFEFTPVRGPTRQNVPKREIFSGRNFGFKLQIGGVRMRLMARKDATKSQPHGLNDVIGIVLGAAALLLLVALLSYDPHDSASNLNPPNNPLHNLGGPLGAWVALMLFRVFGIGFWLICKSAGFGALFCCSAACAWPVCSSRTWSCFSDCRWH
jgi:hypothetical protein